MQIKSTPEVISQYIPTKTDTLQKAIQAMQIKIDSLEKVVVKTEIGQSFFSDVNANIQSSFASYTAFQLTIFTILTGFAGYFGWKWFMTKINQIKSEARSYTDTNINKIKEKHQEIDDSLISTNYDVARSMYNIMNKEKNKFTMSWSLGAAALVEQLKNYSDDRKKEILEGWLTLSEESLSYIPNKDEQIKETFDDYDQFFNDISKSELEGITNKVKDLKNTLLEKLYGEEKPIFEAGEIKK